MTNNTFYAKIISKNSRVGLMEDVRKLEFLANSLLSIMGKDSELFKKARRKTDKFLKKANNKDEIDSYFEDIHDKIEKAREEWEKTCFLELGNQTPKQFFDSLSSIHDFIKLISLCQENHISFISQGFYDSIENRKEVFSKELLYYLQTVKLDENKNLNAIQKVSLSIINRLSLPEYLDTLLAFIPQFDNEKTENETIILVMDAIVDIGVCALEPLIIIADGIEKKGRVYEELMLLIAKIASKSKSEQIYHMLKDYFRKSEDKLIASHALLAYGDGRVIPAIRGYIEKNLENISFKEYYILSESINALGGNTDDLDDYFYNGYDDEDDDDYYNDFDDEYDGT